MVLSAERARALGVEPHGARARASRRPASTRKVMGIGVVPAVRQAARAARAARSTDFDLVEVNEAFAAQVLACDRELGFDPERLNVNGGAIALGHPIGATGARIVVTLLHEMARRARAPRPGHAVHQRRHGPGGGLRGRLDRREGGMADDLDPHDVDVFAPPRERATSIIQLDTAQGIARITLNRPPANVLSDRRDGGAQHRARVARVPARREARGARRRRGKYFSAGFELGDHLGDRAYVMLESFRRIFENLAKLDKPTLGRGGGPGAGRRAACWPPAATWCWPAASAKFGHPEIKGGVFNTVAAALLPRLVGRKKAFEMILGGASL